MGRGAGLRLFSVSENEKNGEALRSAIWAGFDNFGGGESAHILETSSTQLVLDCDTVETMMEDTGVVFVESPVLGIEISQAHYPAWHHGIIKLNQHRFYIPNVVQGHAADNQMVLALEMTLTFRRDMHGANVIQIGCGYFGVESMEHPLGTVGADDGSHVRLQLQGQQTCPATEIEGMHGGIDRHFPQNGCRHLLG